MQSHYKACEKLSLQTLVSKSLIYSFAIASKNSTTIVNDIQPDIYINSSNHRVIPVITDLIDTVIKNAKDSEICITAERFRELIILQVQDLHNNNGYALGFSLQLIEREATNAGASIQFKDQQCRVATISLSFSN